MSRLVVMSTIVLLGLGAARADVSLLPVPAAVTAVSVPQPSFAFPTFPWDTNALADSLDQSGPPDGALTIARAAGPDSSIIILAYNFLYNGWWCRVSRSTDGGQTYTPVSLDSGFYVDDVLSSNRRDTVYLITIISRGGYHLFLQRSTDAGATWGDTIRVDRGTSTFTDKPMIASQDSFIYCTYTDFSGGTNYIRVCRSSDYGNTWNTGDVNVSTSGGQGSCPAVSRDSMVYVTWGQPASWVPRQLWFNRSTDYGLTWGTPRQIDDIDTAPHMYRWRANHSFPAMAVDSTGKLYITVQNRLHGAGYDIAVYTSTNQGDSWAGPFMVNDDTVLDSDQYCSWITLDLYGRPHVFWYDNRDYYPDSVGDMYYSWSEDGGVTWQPNERVNDASPCWSYRSKSLMGDYQQIACDTNFVYCEWSDHRNGRHSWSYIAAARRPLPAWVGVSEKPKASPWQRSKTLLGPNVPNPVVSGTRISFELARTQRADLQVFDLAGKLVRTVLGGDLAAGNHSVAWDTRDNDGRLVPAGIYCYRLASAGTTATRNLVVTR